MKKEFLGLVEVVGSTGVKALFKLIWKVLREKGVDISQKQLSRFDGTNTMSGGISGLPRRLRYLLWHSKYISYRNHQLTLLPKYKTLMDVDAIIISVWRLMKYSTVKASVFEAAQTTVAKKNPENS